MCERLGSKRYTKISLSPEIEKGKKKVQKSFGYLYVNCGLPWWLRGIESGCQCRRHRFDPWVRKIPWRRDSNPLQCSCLENPMDRGAWRAVVHGEAKSWT